MSFKPPRCPNARCPRHLEPEPGFYRRHGWYRPKCRPEPQERFRCRHCKCTFSRQSFRFDFRDQRPEVNTRVFQHLISGAGLRQTGRMTDLSLNAVLRKLHKMSRLCARLHANLCRRLPEGRTYLLDEEETFEAMSIRPLTMPVLIERTTWFVVGTNVGSIRRLAPEGTRRRKLQERDEERHGVRPDESSAVVEAVLRLLRAKAPTGRIVLQTDEKVTYGSIAQRLFGERLVHETTPGTRHRDTFNPLFPINTTMAMTRDNCGRLRRRSWLVSKRRERLHQQMYLFTVYRNYVRPRFNHDNPEDTPAKILGLVPRNLEFDEVLAWHQNWRRLSIHPTSEAAQTTIG